MRFQELPVELRLMIFEISYHEARRSAYRRKTSQLQKIYKPSRLGRYFTGSYILSRDKLKIVVNSEYIIYDVVGKPSNSRFISKKVDGKWEEESLRLYPHLT